MWYFNVLPLLICIPRSTHLLYGYLNKGDIKFNVFHFRWR